MGDAKYARRSICFFVMIQPFLIAAYSKEMQWFRQKLNFPLILTGTMVFMFLLIWTQDLIKCDEFGRTAAKKCTDYVVQNAEPGERIFTEFGAGDYAEWKGLKCYIDTRAETFTKTVNQNEDIITEYMDVYGGHTYYKDFLDKYGFSYLIVDERNSLYTYLSRDSAYSQVYKETQGDTTYYVFMYQK